MYNILQEAHLHNSIHHKAQFQLKGRAAVVVSYDSNDVKKISRHCISAETVRLQRDHLLLVPPKPELVLIGPRPPLSLDRLTLGPAANRLLPPPQKPPAAGPALRLPKSSSYSTPSSYLALVLGPPSPRSALKPARPAAPAMAPVQKPGCQLDEDDNAPGAPVVVLANFVYGGGGADEAGPPPNPGPPGPPPPPPLKKFRHDD